MAYTLVRFLEGENVEESIVPTNWIVKDQVYWSGSIHALRDLKQKVLVNLKWPSYQLVATKISDGMSM